MSLRHVLLAALLLTSFHLSVPALHSVTAATRPSRRVDAGLIARDGQPTVTGERFIVTFRDDVRDGRDLAVRLGRDREFAISHVYRHALKGFAARLPDATAAALRRHPSVASVEPDHLVRKQGQIIPSGITRIGAGRATAAKASGAGRRVDVDVAVIDGLVDPTHPDLNVWTVIDCTDDGSRRADAHGTHVAGTIGALDNGAGVVGVAPGARIWSIKVFGAGVEAPISWVLCGLDAVERYATDQGDGLGTIEVANMSLSGPVRGPTCDSGGMHRAVCRVVAAGVTVVVSAGNRCRDAAAFEPAAFAEVITVSALADSDGRPGAAGPGVRSGNCTEDFPDRDDTLASFSNFGPAVDLAAPGVNILSTVPGGYAPNSGTSMASPHVAGAAALYKAAHPASAPAKVKRVLRKVRERRPLPNDPDGVDEGILHVVP